MGTGGAALAATVAPEPLRGRTVAFGPCKHRFPPLRLVLPALGQTVTLTAPGRDQNGAVMTGVPVSWTTSDAGVATVSASGVVTAAGKGAATITAAAGNAAATAPVAVEQEVAGVVVSPAATPGETVRLLARAADANGHEVAGASFRWTSGDESIATVDGTGLVRRTGEGNTTIAATSEGVAGMSSLTVSNPDPAALVALYHAAGGPDWERSGNWLTDAPVGEWEGVQADETGRVVWLNLRGNQRSGSRPPELGQLASVQTLNLAHNSLSGPIPEALTQLALDELDLRATDVCAPNTYRIQAWLRSIRQAHVTTCN